MRQDATSTDQSILTSSHTSLSKISLTAILVFTVGVLYYCFAYLLRVYPSVMENDLRGYFHITAGSFGLLTSFYYFAYAPMQLPVGVSVDKIGPRRSLILACIISTFGVFLFAYFDNFGLSILGRFLIGLGSAFAYVTALKLAAVWLPRKYFATATGMVTGFGMVSAIFTDMYLTHVIQVNGFKTALYFPLYSGVIVLCLIILFVKDKPSQNLKQNSEESHALSFLQLKQYLKQIVKSRQMWLIGFIGALLYLPATVFLDVWAIPFLRNVDHLSAQNAALGVSFMFAGWILSSFSSCAISDYLGTRKIPIVIASVLATIISSIVIFCPNLPTTTLYIFLFIFGVCCGPHPLCFTLSKENNVHKISGTAVSFANFIIMMGGFVFQPVVGKILDFVWQGHMANGIRVYSTHSYCLALSVIPIGLLISTLCSFKLKETYQKI